MKTWPTLLVVDLGRALPDFMNVFCSEPLTSLDPAQWMVQILEIVRILDEVEDRLANAAMCMGEGEAIFDDMTLSPELEQKLINAIVEFGNNVINKLQQLNAYSSGYFPYTFQEFADERSVVFRHTGFALPVDVYHHPKAPTAAHRPGWGLA